MHRIHANQITHNENHRRAGLLALGEIAVVISTVMLLVLTGSQLARTWAPSTDSQHSLARASVDRPIYRLMLDRSSDRIWVFRPTNEIVLLNPRTAQIENSRETCDLNLIEVAHSEGGLVTLLVSHELSITLLREGHPTLFLKLNAESASFTGAAVSADGSLALVALCDGTVLGWSVHGDQVTQVNGTLDTERRLVRMAMNRQGDRLLASFDDGTSSIFNPLTGQVIRDLITQPGECCTAAIWSEEGRQIAIASLNGDIELFDTESGQQVWRTDSDGCGHLIRITSLAMSPNGRWLAASGMSTRVVVWDVTSPHSVRRLSGHEGLVRAITFSANGQSVFSGGYDGTIREWSTESSAQLKQFD